MVETLVSLCRLECGTFPVKLAEEAVLDGTLIGELVIGFVHGLEAYTGNEPSSTSESVSS